MDFRVTYKCDHFRHGWQLKNIKQTNLTTLQKASKQNVHLAELVLLNFFFSSVTLIYLTNREQKNVVDKFHHSLWSSSSTISSVWHQNLPLEKFHSLSTIFSSFPINLSRRQTVYQKFPSERERGRVGDCVREWHRIWCKS